MIYEEGDIARHDFEVDEVHWFSIDAAIERASYRAEREIPQPAKEEWPRTHDRTQGQCPQCPH